MGDLNSKDPSGTDTGNPTTGGEGTDNTAGGGCDEAGRTDVALDAQTELGFSAAQLLALAEGEHAFPIVWQGDAESASASLQGTQTTMHVKLTRKPGASAQLVDLEPHVSTGAEDGFDIGTLGVPCPDRLEIDVEVALSTEDGALSESFDATLISSDGLSASWSASIDFADLNGSLQVSLSGSPAGSHLMPLSVQMMHTSFAIQGSLSAGIEGKNGSAAWSGVSRLAEWPRRRRLRLGRRSGRPRRKGLRLFAARRVERDRGLLPDFAHVAGRSEHPVELCPRVPRGRRRVREPHQRVWPAGNQKQGRFGLVERPMGTSMADSR